MRFDGKVAFVTGGASGLGPTAAERFAGEGARVAVADIDSDGARRVASRLPDGDWLSGHECGSSVSGRCGFEAPEASRAT
jgi:NAD(P)-dependent dehydrogenase (short-subunit alcohol dehydrogenase family)